MLGFGLAGALGTLAYFAPVIIAATQQVGQRGSLGGSAPPPPDAAFTVLLLGSDDDAKFDPKHLLTQSMILVRVDPKAKQATMLSIPRDLYVPISPNGTEGKIMTAYEFGGAKTSIATVEKNLNVHVDDYVWIGLKGLIHLVDKVNGVDVVTSNPVLDDFYPADIGSADPYGYTRVAVLPGPQHLGGDQALKYVRSRHGDLRGDLGRSQRQQQVLLALRAKSKSLNVTDLPALAQSFNGEFSTSISLDRFGSLLSLGKAFDGAHVKQLVLLPPYTSNGQVGDQDVLLPNWTEIRPRSRQLPS